MLLLSFWNDSLIGPKPTSLKTTLESNVKRQSSLSDAIFVVINVIIPQSIKSTKVIGTILHFDIEYSIDITFGVLSSLSPSRISTLADILCLDRR